MLTPKPAIELLAPAGSPEALDAAVAEGADAIYLGLQNFNARMRSANFTYSQFESALRSLRRMGKKLYVTVNTVFEQREADRMYQLLKYLAGTDPDAIIVQDYGVIAMARAEFPSLKLHASTQMNIASSRGANQLSKYGLSRIILARELCLEELRSIRSETNAELEVFTHGALCVSASGICLFSSFLGGKSANRGMCTQACRRLYNCDTAGADGDSSGYFFSPGDLQLLERLPQLAAAGIDAIKIEGRMKSASYVGVAVSAYRMVLDAIAETNSSYNNDSEAAGGAVGKAPSEKIAESIRRGREILMGDFAREKTQFYFDGVGAKPELWLNPGQDGGTGIPLGEILKIKGSGGESRALFCPENGAAPAAGDSLRIHRRDDSERLPYKLAFSEPAAGGGFWVSVPPGFYPGDRAYLIQTKGASKRYAPVIARGAKGRHPGMDRSPLPQVNFKGGRGNKGRKGSGSATFPQGLYVAASRAEDLYIVQSARPVRVILSLSQKNMKRLLSATPPLPFKPQDIILSLPVYFPQETALALAPG
ncbi:MAG: U32 family peptidase, partial [Spirochaetes bacterium]|nr:U32 family peptidase [Spirochaetota bacterium]